MRERALQKESRFCQVLPFEFRQVMSPVGLHFLSCTMGIRICPHRVVMSIRKDNGWGKHIETAKLGTSGGGGDYHYRSSAPLG